MTEEEIPGFSVELGLQQISGSIALYTTTSLPEARTVAGVAVVALLLCFTRNAWAAQATISASGIRTAE